MRGRNYYYVFIRYSLMIKDQIYSICLYLKYLRVMLE
uniref:Uncharacterized protein n=1 Tax=Ascaris lumbricoides TaxID=6252 RepID=A0A0M3II19_ASCLU